MKGTIFENRIAKGRGGNCTITTTENIVDLSTLEQMLLLVVSDGMMKTEHFLLNTHNRIYHHTSWKQVRLYSIGFRQVVLFFYP